VLIAGMGCDRTVTLAPIPLESGAKTVIVLFVSARERSFSVLDLLGNPDVSVADRSYRADDPVTVTALVYTSSVGELLLEPTAAAVPIPDLGRPLPSTDSVFRASARARTTSAWTPIPFDPASAALPFLTAFDTSKCGGCIVASSSPLGCPPDPPPDARCITPCPIRAPTPPMPPDTPRLGSLTSTCPLGRATSQPFSCAIAEAQLVSCPFPTVQLFGATGCADLDPGCPPAQSWRADLPATSTVVFVNSSAAPGSGNGTRSTPFSSIGEAAAAHPSGAVLALSDGSYAVSETLDLSRFAIWGLCASMTALVPSVAAAGSVVTNPRELRHLNLRGTTDVAIGTSATTLLDRVIVDGAHGFGLLANGATVTVDRLLIRGGTFGIACDHGARLEAHNTTLEASGTGLLVSGASSVGLEDVMVRDQTDLGINVGAGSILTATRADVAHDGQGIIVEETGTRLVLRDSIVRDASSATGYGLSVSNGASIDLARVAVLRSSRSALALVDGSRASILRSIISQNGDLAARAVGIEVGDSTLVIERTWMDSNLISALWASGSSARITASDVVVRTTGESPAESSTGLEARDGATIEAVRLSITSWMLPAIVSFGGSLALSDVQVDGTNDPLHSFGLLAAHASVTATRTAFLGGGGLSIATSASWLADLQITEARAFGGAALVGGSNDRMIVERAAVEGGASTGIFLSDIRGATSLTDLDLSSDRVSMVVQNSSLPVVLGRVKMSSTTDVALLVRCASLQLVDADVRSVQGAALSAGTATCSTDLISGDHLRFRSEGETPIDSHLPVDFSSGEISSPQCSVAIPAK
jgi:hypothetical protein